MGKLYNYSLAAGMILFSLFNISNNAFAQIPLIEIDGTLNGETIVSLNSSDFPYATTTTYIYRVTDNIMSAVPRGKKIFISPGGTSIKAFASKRIFDNVTMRFKDTLLLVLLNDGVIYAADLNYQNFHYYSTVGSIGSESWKKILGEAVYALSSSYLYVSRDNGTTWQKDTAGLNNAHIVDFDQDTTLSKLYAATSSGLIRKDTLPGSPWSKVVSFTGTTNVYKVFIDKKNRILTAGNGSGLWISTDNGASWSIDTVGLGPNGTLTVFGEDVFGNLYGANTNLYRSVNGTQPWEQIDAGILSISGNTPLFNAISGDSTLFAATSYGLFFSRNQGNTWAKADSGISSENSYGLVRLNNGKVFIGNSLGVFSKNLTDSTWTKSYPQNGYSGKVNVFADNAGNLYALDNNISHGNNSPIPIVKSVDQGLNWTVDTAGISGIDGNLFYIDETGAQHYSNSLYGSSFQCNLWKRTPPGSWIIDTTGFPALNYSFTSTMASDKNGYLYVSGSFSGNKVMRRPIAGGTWVVDTAGLGSSITRFTQMATGHNGDIIGTNGNFLYHKSGGSWSRINLPSSLSSVQLTAAAVDSAGNIFAAFSNFSNLGKGVWYTANMGATWTKAGLDSIEVSQLIPYADTIYALTLGRGTYKMTANTLLPLKLLLFNGFNRGSSNELIWETTDEINTSHFEIERSANASDFFTIGKVHAAGNSARIESYTFFDSSPLPNANYYRLRMEDVDGNYSYSKIVRLYSGEKNRILVTPNPISGMVTISGLSPNLEKTLQLTDIAGKIILQQKTINSSTNFNMHDSQAGIYLLRIWSEHDQYTTKIIKQ